MDAAMRLVAEGGPNAATVAGIAGALGAPVGSIYHRFKSRDLLLARLWIRTVKRFQVGFLRRSKPTILTRPRSGQPSTASSGRGGM